MPSITADEIQLFAKLIFDVSGLSLDKDKGYLLETRLSPLLGAQGCSSFNQLYARIKSDNSGRLQHAIVEAMTTNETFFFRDSTPFDLLRHKIIPDLVDRRSKVFHAGKIPIRVWSAACSTGQEVYSIAMTLVEMLGDLSRYDIHILGTDISGRVISQASYGRYNQFEMERGLPLYYRQRYFAPVGADWRIKDEIRSLAQFKTMNLMKPFADLGGKFDLIFCRNVAIYFNQADKVRLFQKIARVLQPDGALIIGGSETLTGIAPDFESRNYLKGIFYQLSGQQTAAPPPRPSPPPHTPHPHQPIKGHKKATVPAAMPAGPLEAHETKQAEAKGHGALAQIDAPQGQLTETAEVEAPVPTIHTPPAPDPLPGPSVATQKKSLLAAIHSSGREPAPSLLSGKQRSAKTSLLGQLQKKKKKTNE